MQHDTLHVVSDREGLPFEMYERAPYNEPIRLMGWDWNKHRKLVALYDYWTRYSFSYINDTTLAGITFATCNSTSGIWSAETEVIAEFDKDGDIIAKKSGTGWNRYFYYDLPNTIGEFLQFNVANQLGMEIISIYPFCVKSKKLLKRIELVHNSDTYDITYEFNEGGQIVKARSFATRNGEPRGTFTSSFFYECN